MFFPIFALPNNTKMKHRNSSLILATVLIVFAALTRLLPHYPNFTAVGAIALFGGAVIKDKKLSIFLPLAALFLSDICLQLFTATKGFYGSGQIFIYASFVLITWLATFMKKKNAVNIVFAGIWSGLLFFLISNFGEWLFSTLYPRTLAGLAEGYVAAIPFYKGEIFGSFFFNTIFGNLFYSAVLFGMFYTIRGKQNISVKAPELAS